jgi:hypothetical protein
MPMFTSVDGSECDLFWDAHLETPGVIDLRISRQGWAQIKGEYASHPAVHRDPSRRDWIGLRPRSLSDLDRLASLLPTAVAANA